MLREYPVAQHPEEPVRRWFADDQFDLVVWLGVSADIVGFQLCYDKYVNEHALTWKFGEGYHHNAIDDGEATPFSNRSPILVADGLFPLHRVLTDFMDKSAEIEDEIRVFIIEKLRGYQ
jgi:hypothetical protein